MAENQHREIITYEQALQMGLKRYFTGKSCKRGHIDDFLISNQSCAVCNRLRVKEWLKLHPEKKKEKSRKRKRKRSVEYRKRKNSRRRSRKNNSSGTHTAEQLRELLKKQKYRCANCFTAFKKTGYHVDHIIALAKGGTNWITNIQLLCPPCNIRKSDKDPLQFAAENGRLL